MTVWVNIIIGILTIGVVGLYTHYTKLQWNEATKAAQATAENAKTASDALEFAERPWLSVKFKIVGPLYYLPSEGVQTTIAFLLENAGHSPAVGITLRYHFIADEHHVTEMLDEQERTL